MTHLLRCKHITCKTSHWKSQSLKVCLKNANTQADWQNLWKVSVLLYCNIITFWNIAWLIKTEDWNKCCRMCFIIELSKQWTSLTYSMKFIYYPFIISVCVCASHQNLVPHWQYSEYEGTECGSEISSPVIPHSKICRRGPQYWTTHLRDRESKSKNR